MRAVLASVSAIGLLMTLCASADAATRHRTFHAPAHHQVVVPAQGAPAPRFAVPGWSDDATRRWLDNASSGWSQA